MKDYAAIEWRVIDSAAYADLSHSACRLLMLLARQLTKGNNNGNLQATYSWCKKRGIGSEHTLRDAIADLIAHGFICRTRSHGANGTWAKYAVTWLPVKNSNGLYLDCFLPDAWSFWRPTEKNSYRQKLQDTTGKNCSFKAEFPAKSAVSPPAKIAEYELSTPVQKNHNHFHSAAVLGRPQVSPCLLHPVAAELLARIKIHH